MTSSRTADFAATYALLTAAHEVADHWIQLDSQAVTKGEPGAKGQVACLRHVGSYTVTQAVALATGRMVGLRIGWRRAVVGLTVSAVTHYVADRCAGHWRELDDGTPVPAVLRLARRRHADWLIRDPAAGYLMDQAWHKGWIAVAALVSAGGKATW